MVGLIVTAGKSMHIRRITKRFNVFRVKLRKCSKIELMMDGGIDLNQAGQENSQQPKVSIITPVYNAAGLIEACLKSVAQQSYPNKEHWIIDGRSKDDTVNIVKRYQVLYPHIKLVS